MASSLKDALLKVGFSEPNHENKRPIKKKKKIAVFGKISYYSIAAGTGSGGIRSNKYEISVNEGLKSAGFKILKEMEKDYTDFIEKTKRENLVPPYFDNPKMRKDNGIIDDQAPPHFKKRLVAFSKEQAMSKADIKQYESKADVAVITLGRSGGENYENGYLPITQVELDLVKDVCDVCMFLMEHRKDSGIYNLGSGKARTFLDLGRNTFQAMRLSENIEFIPTPEDIRDKYQYFTEADMEKLKSIGYDKEFTSLEEGIRDYVGNYLLSGKYY